MLLPPVLTVNVEVVMVEESIVSLNVAVMVLLTATPTAPLAGLVELTVGGTSPARMLSSWVSVRTPELSPCDP